MGRTFVTLVRHTLGTLTSPMMAGARQDHNSDLFRNKERRLAASSPNSESRQHNAPECIRVLPECVRHVRAASGEQMASPLSSGPPAVEHMYVLCVLSHGAAAGG